MEKQTQEEKKKKRSIFSLDPHMKIDISLRDTFRSFSGILKTMHASTLLPIMDLGSAMQSWGLTGRSREEIELFRRRRQVCGIFSAVLLCFMFLLAGWNWYHNTFGILSGIQYALGGFALLALTSVCFWQADTLSGEKFKPFFQYAAGFRWLFGLALLALTSSYEGQALAAMPGTSVDMPDFVVKNPSDLSAIFVGSIIGESWVPHAGVSLSALNALGMDSVLIPILAAVNTGAMLFVTVYATYIHTFGAVHIAHTGKWEDNQMFSSLWSPVRSVVALGLCSPVANGVSLMQHLILVAIAMSINFADNVSHSFVTYLAQDSSVKGFALSTPAIRQSGNDFVPIFTSVVTASVIQSSWLNMEGSEANPNKLEGNDISVEIRQVDEPATTLLGVKKQSVVEYAALIKFGGPSPQKVMPTIKVTAKNSKLAEAYGRAIQNMFTTVRKFTDEYFSTKIEDRRQNEVQIPDMIKQCRKQFDSDINTAQKALADVSEGAEKAMRLVSRMYTNTEMYGWVTVGLYPFIVAKAQSDWQSAFSVSVSTSSISWNEVSEYTTLSNQETQIVEKFFAEISKSEKESSAFSSVTAFLDTPVPSGEDILPPILRIFMDNFGVTPATLAKEFEEKNAVAVMNSKGVQCMTAAAAAMSQFGVISEKAKDKGIEGLLQGYGLNAGKMDSGFLKSLNGAVGIWSPVILVALSVVLLFGFSCAYVIPAIPIVFWGRALSSWAVLLVQTMMGAPFWAAAHVLPEGQGLAGQHARQGYLMLLDVFIRPTLLTCGAIMSMLLMEAWTKVLAKILFMWADLTIDAAEYNYIGFFFTTGVCLFVMYTTIRWLFIQAIGEFPQQVIRWCGGQVHDSSIQDANQSAQAITGKMQEAMYLMRSPRTGGMPGALGQTLPGGRKSKSGND